MKKIFSMLLVAAMLVAMLPCFAVGASAVDAGAVKINATAVNSADPWASAWAGGTTAVGGDLYAQGGTVAELEYPTVIDRLEIIAGPWGGRAGAGNKLLASVDGETWEELVSAFGIPNKKENTVVTLDVTSEKAYRYVKIVATPSNSAANWSASAKTFTVYGVRADAYTDADVKGIDVAFTQTKIDDTAWSVRFVSTVDKAEVDANTYSMIGYNIAAYGTNIQIADGTPTKYWTNLESNVVYTGVYEVQEGSDDPVLTAAPDGSYFHMVTFKDISLADYEDVTFVITPYAVLSDGETYVYSNAKTIKFVDGVRADA